MSVDFEKQKNGIAVITFNRPEKLNSVTKDDREHLAELLEQVRSDSTIKVTVITGAGDRAFTAGNDLAEPLPAGDPLGPYREIPEGLARKMIPYGKGIEITKPMIAAINGHSIALGACLILATDVRYASPNATFSLNEVRFASLADGGALARLPRQIPYVHAMRLLLTGDRIDANEMLRIGLINEIVPQPQLMARAMETAEQIAGFDEFAVQITKQSVHSGLDVGVNQAITQECLFREMLTVRQGGREASSRNLTEFFTTVKR
jgi:E-phenylitaconyl-CoA hydratase